LANCGEAEALTLDGGVLVGLLDLGVAVEHNGVVVLNARVPLVGHLDLSIGEEVDFVLLEDRVEVVGLFVEKGSLNLRSLIVNQLHVQQSALPSRILPSLLNMFLGDTRLNLPVEEESVETLDGRVALGETL